MGGVNHHFNEKRGMICKIVTVEGNLCGKVAMYHAGPLGFCFDHKPEAIHATLALKKKHQSRSAVNDQFRKMDAKKTFD